jgi:hypothetical protein
MTPDFETHPLGTGRELARLNDLVQELANSASILVDNVLMFSEEDAYKWHSGAIKAMQQSLAKAGR